MKLMKRLFICAFALVMAISTSITAFASQVTENGLQDATVQYYVSGSYTIDIPAYIDVTYGASFYASELNIADDSYISVTLSNAPEGGIYTLTHTSGTGSVNIILVGNNGEVTGNGQELARLDINSNTSTPFNAVMVDEATNLKAGAYRGTVTFFFNLMENYY